LFSLGITNLSLYKHWWPLVELEDFFQIIATIVQGVSANFPCTWEEALIFRRDHIGTPEQAVRSLVYLKNQMRYQQGIQATPGVYFINVLRVEIVTVPKQAFENMRVKQPAGSARNGRTVQLILPGS
jgi:hypothetical protein